MEQLHGLAGAAFVLQLRACLETCPDPFRAGVNLQRWLSQTSSPLLYAEQFGTSPKSLEILTLVLGSSQPLADALLQNPEFGTLFLDDHEFFSRLSIEQLVAEGKLLLRSATNSNHALDRIRYLRQKYNLIISANDLVGSRSQPEIWGMLSDLAEAVVRLTFEASWSEFSAGKNLPPAPPITIIAFGKLGARELNYSSDIDLAYLLDEHVSEQHEKHCLRFCATFGRALSDRMGRGALYRVDLRLRPYGSQGPILARMSTYRSYYRLYAETWEVQALIKSRVIYGPPDDHAWAEMREEKLFATSLSDASIEEVLQTRARIEENAPGEDLKRGAGGIRDVEFLCQTLQLIHGKDHPLLRVESTCDALAALSNEHLLNPGVGEVLVYSYTFLRKLEHRLQLLGDRQTHTLPSDAPTLTILAKTMGLEDARILDEELTRVRKSVRSLYRSLLKEPNPVESVRTRLASELGSDASVFLQWFDALPEPERFYASLDQSPPAWEQVRKIVRFAPALAERFKSQLPLTEALIADEIGEFTAYFLRWRSLPNDAAERLVADAYANLVAAGFANWVLSEEDTPEMLMREATDQWIQYVCRRFGAGFHVIAMGSYGCAQQSLGSDIDLIFLSDTDQAAAERQAQQTLNFLIRMRRHGGVPQVDLRLRPDGSKGLLVRSFSGFSAYEERDMELWERFALGSARLVFGDNSALKLVHHAATRLRLTRSRLKELLEMKTRIETERLKPNHRNRDVKLGWGGLTDIEWTVHLLELSRSTPGNVELGATMPDRIRDLGREQLLNAIEVDSLLKAHRHLLDVRGRLRLLNYEDDLMPENPIRLSRLAEAFRLSDSNDLLRMHESIVSWTRALFQDTISRLKT